MHKESALCRTKDTKGARGIGHAHREHVRALCRTKCFAPGRTKGSRHVARLRSAAYGSHADRMQGLIAPEVEGSDGARETSGG
jgi:hypothetical protein